MDNHYHPINSLVWINSGPCGGAALCVITDRAFIRGKVRYSMYPISPYKPGMLILRPFDKIFLNEKEVK